MSFSARHYNQVARIIAEVRARYTATHGATAAREIQRELRQMFAADNPRFDGARFDLNCEPKP